MENTDKVFSKSNSFKDFKNLKTINEKETISKVINIFENKKNEIKLKHSSPYYEILIRAISDIKENKNEKGKFNLNKNTLMEINTFDKDLDIMKYLIHRYRYEIFPEKKLLDEFPPLIQIEPSSICNFRCVFCFETDKTFTDKKSGHMGTMDINLFKKIIDEIEGNIEFLTLASRGEPLVANNFIEMLEYCKGKFLNLKINTNASLLSEDKSHAILKNDVKTIVFSADAADKKLYEELRVNGKFEKTLDNISKFNEIRKKYYPNKKIITRVSGVKFSSDQNFEKNLNLWGKLVDQVVFVDYNPWENNYEKKANGITKPCSDLWRRMFVWWDGKINPCDVDYKSKLSVGNIKDQKIINSWNSKKYNYLREEHIKKRRSNITPCKSCSVV